MVRPDPGPGEEIRRAARWVPAVVGGVLFLLLLGLEIGSLVRLHGEFTGPSASEGRPDIYWRLRIRVDRDAHAGWIAGSVLGLAGSALLGFAARRRTRAALLVAGLPVGLGALSWFDPGWSFRSAYLPCGST